MAEDCVEHSGQGNRDQRLPLDGIMQGLPDNQSGDGRHKCAYCAYERGVKAGKRAVIDRLTDLLLNN